MGFGDLDYEKDEDFLSESSFAESDFQLLMNDNFYDVMKEIQEDLGDLQQDHEIQDIEIESDDEVI